MITCQHARHLFDRYLDGELPPSLQTELHAHQLSCSDCQSELALIEACGDVVSYDRSEPQISASFTDRVLLAHRAQIKVTPRRSWSRLVISIASPVAAAACIGMAVLLIAPAGPTNRSLIAGRVDELPASSIGILKVDGQAGLEQASTVQQMPAGIVDVAAEPVVKQARNMLDSVKRGVEYAESLVGMAVAGTHDALAAGQDLETDRQKAGATSGPNLIDPNLVPPLPGQAPQSPDPSDGSEVDDNIQVM